MIFIWFWSCLKIYHPVGACLLWTIMFQTSVLWCNQPGQGLEQVAGQNERSETQVWWTFIKVDLPSIAEWFQFGDVENVQTYSETHMLHVWNIYHHLPHKWPSYVGKYTIHGAYGKHHPTMFLACSEWSLCDSLHQAAGANTCSCPQLRQARRTWRFPKSWGYHMIPPQVTMGFNTQLWSSMTWMIWGYPFDLGNHLMTSVHVLKWLSKHLRPFLVLPWEMLAEFQHR